MVPLGRTIGFLAGLQPQEGRTEESAAGLLHQNANQKRQTRGRILFLVAAADPDSNTATLPLQVAHLLKFTKSPLCRQQSILGASYFAIWENIGRFNFWLYPIRCLRDVSRDFLSFLKSTKPTPHRRIFVGVTRPSDACRHRPEIDLQFLQ
jgi:hypothetical protein